MMARHRLKQHAELTNDALAFRARLRRHHPHLCRGSGDVLAGPWKEGHTMLIV
jgi:hypothetical protein